MCCRDCLLDQIWSRISKTTYNPPFFRLATTLKLLKFSSTFMFLFYSVFSNFRKRKKTTTTTTKWITHLSLKIKIKSRFHLQFLWNATIVNFWIPLPSWSPHKPYTPASLHLTFPLVSRVYVRRPSDFRLTFTNTVAVLHYKASCRFHFVFVQ